MAVKKAPVGAAWAPAPYEPADIAAIQGLMRGDAQPHQQQRALRWIIEVVAATYDTSYRPESERDTCFAEGRRFVGTTLVKATKIDISKLKKDLPNG